VSSSSVKREDVVKVEKRLKEDKPLVCYNCGGTGAYFKAVPQ